MKKFDFYEFTGVLAPGVIVLYGIAQIYPALGLLTKNNEVSFGEFGLMLILAYVAGHLVQSFGNLVEYIWWKFADGWPSDWVRTRKHGIIETAQWNILPTKIRDILQIKCPDDLSTLSSEEWKPITRQIYSAVRNAGRADRVDIFNGNYGMLRGVAAALGVILIVVFSKVEVVYWKLYAALAVMVLLALIRMHRFGVHYARELFVQFIGMQPGDKAEPKEENGE